MPNRLSTSTLEMCVSPPQVHRISGNVAPQVVAYGNPGQIVFATQYVDANALAHRGKGDIPIPEFQYRATAGTVARRGCAAVQRTALERRARQ